MEDYRLFADGYVVDLKFSTISAGSDIVAFRAEVKPTQKEKTYLNTSTYNLWIIVDKNLGEVKAAYFECIGG